MRGRSGVVLGLSLALMVSLGLSSPGSARVEKPPSDSRSAIEVKARENPLMKITSHKDGKFILEPLRPPPRGPLSEPPPRKDRRWSPTSQDCSGIDCRAILRLILSRVQTLRQARYVRGASLESSSATDCSGLVQFIYRGVKVDLPRTSAEQARVGAVVARQLDCSRLLPGDLLFFRDAGRGVGHAGVYLGADKMLHASRSQGGVAVAELDQGYYVNNFVVAKRVFEKQYKWPAHPGLRPTARYQNWHTSGAAPVHSPRPLPVIASKLLKIFWPGEYKS